MAVSSAGVGAGDDRASAVSTERTPLLHDEERGESQWQSQSETGEAVLDGQRVPRDGELPATKEYTTAEVLLIMSSVWVGVFFAALDMTVVSTLSAPISSYFNSLPLLSWVASSYLVSTSACQPLSGKLTDIFSRKSGLILSNILFGFGNLISGLATEQWMIILGRVIAGMGGGGLNSISTFLTSDLVPLRKRGVWQGVGNICFGVGSAAGGLFGGWVNDNWGWRWAFLIQVPFMVLSTVLVAWKVDVPAKESDRSRLKRIDFLGAFTLTVSLVLLLVGLNTGGNQVPWTHPLILTSLPLSAVFLGVFVYVEEYKAIEPIIPVRLLVHRTVLSACLTNWFCTMNVLAILTYAPIYFQIQGNTATQAGARLAPYAVGTAIGSLGLGVVMRLTGRYTYLGWGSVFALVAANTLMLRFNIYTPAWEPFIVMAVFGFGYGGMLTVTLVALIAAVDQSFQAVVTSASYAFRSTGSCIGITVASAVFQNLLQGGLWSRFGSEPDAAKIIGRLRDRLDEIDRVPINWRAGVLKVYENALRGVFATTLLLAVLGMISVLAMREHKLHNSLARKD